MNIHLDELKSFTKLRLTIFCWPSPTIITVGPQWGRHNNVLTWRRSPRKWLWRLWDIIGFKGFGGHPHHLGQHQTHHFRQHPEITHSSHFGRSLWATRISSLWATRKTSFLSSHYLTQPFRVWLGGVGGGGQKRHWCWEQGWTWLSHLGFGWGGWGGTKASLMLGTRVGSMDLNHHLTQPFRVWLGGVWGVCVCVKRSFLLLAQRIYATPWADLLLHLHTNMISRYHIFSWHYHHHEREEDEDE